MRILTGRQGATPRWLQTCRQQPFHGWRTFRWPMAAAMLAAAIAVEAGVSAPVWRIDETHTSIGFKIDAVGFPATQGRFTRYSGDISIDFDRPAKSYTRF